MCFLVAACFCENSLRLGAHLDFFTRKWLIGNSVPIHVVFLRYHFS